MGVRTAAGVHGVVASGHTLASDAALTVLRGGGNALDAAVCAAFVLGVVCPYATSIGGDVYILLFDAKSGRVQGINGTGSAPARAERSIFEPDIPRDGIRSVSIPGFVAGIADALARFGTRGLGELVAPAQRLAAEGFTVHRTLARNIANRMELLLRDESAASIFLPNGAPPAEGAMLLQPDLAWSLGEIAIAGPRVFYEGPIGQRIVAHSERLGGLLGTDDFSAHKSLWQDPMVAPFYRRDVVTMPPNSYGLTLLLQLIELEHVGIRNVDPAGAQFFEHCITARRKAYRAANGLIGDPASLEGAARQHLAQCNAMRRLPVNSAAPAPEPRDTDTTNVVVIDGDGNAVSLIQSISAPFGSGVVPKRTGIVLNNRMGGFVTKCGDPNCVGPGRRPAHTLSPCLVLESGRVTMSVGTPGAVGQTCTLAQFLARTLACGQPIDAAIAAPRWSVDLRGAPVIEAAADARIVAALQEEEPALRTMHRGWQTFGSLKTVVEGEKGLEGFSDTRREASVAAY